MKYSGLVYLELQIWLWVNTLHLGTWTLLDRLQNKERRQTRRDGPENLDKVGPIFIPEAPTRL